jgi:hypothetical protein
MRKVVFVYRKNNDEFINGIFDFFHKLMMPSTYSCDSCEVTHNYLGMRNAWKSYLEWLPLPSDFFDEEQFLKTFPNATVDLFPCVFILDKDQTLEQIISSKELKNAGMSELTSLLHNQLVSCKLDFIDK